MGKTKTVFKWFSIAQYKQEEEYLSLMHKKGWKLTKVTFPGFYHFRECEPENVTYRLDFNQEGIANKSEYVQMFSDCGWEYLFDYVGYSYFRKASDEADANEEIFCDDSSRLDMMKRVFRGRVRPLIVIFFCLILPQLIMNTIGYGTESMIQDVLAIVFLVLGILYIILFGVFSIQFYQYEKRLNTEDSKLKIKYIGILAGLIVCALIMIMGVFYSFRSEYQILDNANGFSIEADRLNTGIVREYELEKGDVIEVTHQSDGGKIFISIAKTDEEPIFYGNTYDEFEDFSVEIQEDGCYRIECSGKKAKGKVEFIIK